LRGTPSRGEVILWPLEDRHAAAIQQLRQARLLVAAGVALDPDAVTWLDVDGAFPLADHGDLPSLVAHARAAEARDVWLTSEVNDRVARAFAAARIRVHALGVRRPMEQMALFADGTGAFATRRATR
jgi:hypothetical protein